MAETLRDQGINQYFNIMSRYQIKYEDHDNNPQVQFINAKNDNDFRKKVIAHMDMSLMEKKSTVITKLIKL